MGRTVNVKIRFEPEEAVHLKKCAASSSARFKNDKINFSEYLRGRLLSRSGFRDEEMIRQLRDLRYELRKIGTNVNQVAHKVNAGFGTAKDLIELKNYLVEIETAIDNVSEEVQQYGSHMSDAHEGINRMPARTLKEFD